MPRIYTAGMVLVGGVAYAGYVLPVTHYVGVYLMSAVVFMGLCFYEHINVVQAPTPSVPATKGVEGQSKQLAQILEAQDLNSKALTFLVQMAQEVTKRGSGGRAQTQ